MKENDDCVTGPPQLMMAFTKDGQLSPGLLASRDERCDKETGDVKAARSHLKLMEPVHPAANHWESGNGEVMQVQCGRPPFKVSDCTRSWIKGPHKQLL